MKRRSAILRRLHGSYRVVRGGNRRRTHPPAGQHFVKNEPIGAIVVDDQHRHPAKILHRRIIDRLAPGSRHEARRKMKGASLAFDALHPKPTSHQSDEALRDRETQTGSSVRSRRRAICLRECIED